MIRNEFGVGMTSLNDDHPGEIIASSKSSMNASCFEVVRMRVPLPAQTPVGGMPLLELLVLPELVLELLVLPELVLELLLVLPELLLLLLLLLLAVVLVLVVLPVLVELPPGPVPVAPVPPIPPVGTPPVPAPPLPKPPYWGKLHATRTAVSADPNAAQPRCDVGRIGKSLTFAAHGGGWGGAA
jgi:hypothetical protein